MELHFYTIPIQDKDDTCEGCYFHNTHGCFHETAFTRICHEHNAIWKLSEEE